MKSLSRLGMLAFGLFLSTFSFAQAFNGYALYNSSNSNTAYLIDSEGDIAKTWNCPTSANYACALTPTGNLVRGAVYSSNQINGAAIGGMVQELDSDGSVVWEFIYSTATVISHHDLSLMPNGNVLLIAWEYIALGDLQDIGYAGTGNKYATHIIEVAQNGTGGEIVWEWHIKDHLVQEEDATLANYGIVSEHPELLDINVPVSTTGGGPGGGGPASDWFHFNGIDYNADLDQIVLSSRFLSEVFIIDHSTTTEEAASHMGGNSGKGGDFLYRWGNPNNYDTAGSQIITAACHDARWIPNDGRPQGGYIQIFNNSGDNGGSAVDAIDTPANGYNYDKTAGQQFEPASYSWRHECIANAAGQSSADRNPNGNVFVNLSGNQGGAGYCYEATPEGDVIFQYSADSQKAFKYGCDHPGIQALLENPCEIIQNISEVQTLHFAVFPNPSAGVFQLAGAFGPQGAELIEVRDISGKIVARHTNSLQANLQEQPAGLYSLTAYYGGKMATQRIVIQK